MPKYYVAAGKIQWIGEATTPLSACRKAWDASSKNKELLLDSSFFYVDERGFRKALNNLDDLTRQISTTKVISKRDDGGGSLCLI